MTATALSTTRRSTAVTPNRLTFPRVLRSEWIKLASLRSTWWSLGITAVFTIGIAALIALMLDNPSFPPIKAVVFPTQFTMLLAGILGAISVTGEYSTGMIRSTLTAAPVRGMVLAGKAIVLATLMFVSALLIFVVAALVTMPIFATRDISIPWDNPESSTLPILAASVSMAAVALIGVAFGFIIRSSAGAITTTVGLFFVVPLALSIFSTLGWEWINEVANRLPASAVAQAVTAEEADTARDGYVTLGAWVVAGILGAWAVLRSRDA